MDPKKTIHIKKEETDCAPDEQGLISYGTLAINHQQTIHIKEEETDCVPDEPGLTFPEDPLKPEVPGLPIKPDPELKLHVATSENDSYGTLAMDHQQTTYIKEEETDCAPDEPGLMSYGTLAMNHQQTTYIKEEETDCAPDDQGLMFPEDPLKAEVPGLPIKPDPELKLHDATSENNSVEYLLDTSWTTDFIKEEPPLNLEAEDTANIVVASRNYASNSTRLLKNESCHISIEETVNQGLVHSELELHPKKSMHFPIIGGAEEGGGDQGESVMEQSEEPCSSMEASKTLWTSFNDTCNTTINDNADIIDIYDKGGTSYTTGNINAHNGLPPLKRPHKCDICGKSFSRLHVLKTHTLIHSGIKPHKCDICGKSFSQLGVLKRHALIHGRIKPHKCDICGKSYSQLGGLKTHTLIHSRRTLHKCDICGNFFSQLGSLKRHAVIHSGITPHKCVICGKYFSYLGDLKRHKLIHYGTIIRK